MGVCQYFCRVRMTEKKSQKTHELPDKLKPPDGIFCVVYYTTTHRGGNVELDKCRHFFKKSFLHPFTV